MCDKRLVLFRKEKCQVLWIQEFLFWNLQSSGNCMDSWKDTNASGNVHKIVLVVFPWAKSFPKLLVSETYLPCASYLLQKTTTVNWMVQLHANNDGNQWKYICYNSCKSHGNKTDMLRIYIYIHDYMMHKYAKLI